MKKHVIKANDVKLIKSKIQSLKKRLSKFLQAGVSNKRIAKQVKFKPKLKFMNVNCTHILFGLLTDGEEISKSKIPRIGIDVFAQGICF